MHFIETIKRTTLALPKDASDDEIRENIARAMGIPIELVPAFDKKEALEKIAQQRDEVESIKATYKDLLDSISKVQRSKYDELDDVGRFIYAANNTKPLSIKFELDVPKKPEEFPDFTLKFDQERVGLEHTRLLFNEQKAVNVMIKHCLTHAENDLKDLSRLCKTINIFWNYKKDVLGFGNPCDRNFSLNEKKAIGQAISTYIRAELTGLPMDKPTFIDKITVISNNEKRIDIGLGENYFTELDFSSLLLERINKKEARSAVYREAISVKHLWLLIVIDDVKAYSGFNLTSPLPKIESSNFDCIILFEKFNFSINVLFHKKVKSEIT
jgi:hypothetical protein